MNNILILGAGGPAGSGVIKSLRNINFKGKIISVDYDKLSAGFYLSDSYYVVPGAFDDNYIKEILNIVDKENIDLILPTSSNDIISIFFFINFSYSFLCRWVSSFFDLKPFW